MQYKVTSETTLLPFLLENLDGKSRSSVKSSLVHGQITVNGCNTTRYDFPLRVGDTVTISAQKQAAILRHPLLRIVYEDEWLIVADKRNGLLSVGTDKEQRKAAFYILSEHIKKRDPSAKLFVVHRLDRETSGLMIFAKSQSIQEMLQRNWREAVLERRYVAVIEGTTMPDKGTVSTYFREDRNMKVWACQSGEGSKGITDYRVLRKSGLYTLVELSLQTGKKNQIRAHMEWMKTPVVGDKKYGAHTNPAGRVCLHAHCLGFRHPVTGAVLNFSTGVPRIFEEIVK